MPTLDVVIVDDEPVARGVIRDFLGGVEGVRLAGEAADGRSAVELIDRVRPDLLFLDVRLPAFSGLEVLQQIDHRPAVVFTTAHDDYTISALQAGAVDYLIKPFGPTRLAEALTRVRHRLAAGEIDRAVLDRIREVMEEPPALKRVFVRHGPRVVPVALDTVTRIEASDDYVTLHAHDQPHLLQMTMAEIDRRLDPGRFVRIHRSHIVNLDCVGSVQPFDERRLQVTLRDGTVLVTSRAGGRRLRQLFA